MGSLASSLWRGMDRIGRRVNSSMTMGETGGGMINQVNIDPKNNMNNQEMTMHAKTMG